MRHMLHRASPCCAQAPTAAKGPGPVAPQPRVRLVDSDVPLEEAWTKCPSGGVWRVLPAPFVEARRLQMPGGWVGEYMCGCMGGQAGSRVRVGPRTGLQRLLALEVLDMQAVGLGAKEIAPAQPAQTPARCPTSIPSPLPPS